MNSFGQLVTQGRDLYNDNSCTQQDFDCLTQDEKGARMLMIDNGGEQVISRSGPSVEQMAQNMGCQGLA